MKFSATLLILSLMLTWQVSAQGLETFTSIPANNSSYSSRSWTGDGSIAWTATDARTDQTLNGRCIAIRNGNIQAAAIPNGIGELSFKHQQIFSGTGGRLEVYINDVLKGTVSPTTAIATATITGISISGTFKLEIRQVTSGLRISIDDVAWTAFSSQPCVTPAAQPGGISFSNLLTNGFSYSFTAASPAADKYLVTLRTSATAEGLPQDGTTYAVGAGFGNQTIVAYSNQTTGSVTGLQPGTEYFLNVFAANDLCNPGGPRYLTAGAPSASATTTVGVPCMAPLTAPSGILVAAAGTQAITTFSAVPGADHYLALLGTQPLSGFTPKNGQTYPPGSTAGNARVAYYSPGVGFTLQGLSPNTDYVLTLFAAAQAGCTGGPAYGPAATQLFNSGNALTEIPSGYYDTISGKACADLKSALSWRLNHNLDRQALVPRNYSELWTQYLLSDVKLREVGAGSPTVIYDIYSDNPTGTDPYNFTPGPVDQGGQQDNGTSVAGEGILYNREHTVPLSWFNSSGNTAPGPATDYHHIFPTDKWVNALRDSYIFGEVDNPTTPTLNGGKLGPVAFAGLSGTAFEPIDSFKGDIARAFLYFITRYQAQMLGWTGGTNGTQAFEPNLYPSADLPYLRLMLAWHALDPVSQKERIRNQAGYQFQGNRNPYVDLPELAGLVWSDACGLALPIELLTFRGSQQGQVVQLNWSIARGANIAAFEVERSLDGFKFNQVGRVDATSAVAYQYNDDVSSLGGRRLYYRLRVIFDRKAPELSDIFTLHTQALTGLRVIPQPASGSVYLQFGSEQFSGQVQVISASGQRISAHTLVQAVGAHTLRLPAMAPGVYQLVLVPAGGGKPVVQKLSWNP